MKLIDILKQELPKRGGWPGHSNLVWQDGDGEIRFDGEIDDDFYVKVKSDDAVPVGYYPLIDDVRHCITRKQYEDAVK